MNSEHFNILRSDPHNWGPGKIHIFSKDETWCGKKLQSCPGKKDLGRIEAVTCKVCISVNQSRLKRERWEAESERRERERQEKSRQWWAAYNAYLETPQWRIRRSQVISRTLNRCALCGMKAEHVHHLSYPSGCLPGSFEWIQAEKDYTLIAVCLSCHKTMHKGKSFLFHGVEV